MQVFTAIIGLLDGTIIALMGVPILRELLAAYLLAAAVGLAVMLRNAVYPSGGGKK